MNTYACGHTIPRYTNTHTYISYACMHARIHTYIYIHTLSTGWPLLLFDIGKLTIPQVVEPFFQSGMLWETWQHGPGPLPQYCPALQLSQVFSFTVATVAVPGGAGWYVNQDHSKWGVTSHRVPTCCISEVGHSLAQALDSYTSKLAGKHLTGCYSGWYTKARN